MRLLDNDERFHAFLLCAIPCYLHGPYQLITFELFTHDATNPSAFGIYQVLTAFIRAGSPCNHIACECYSLRNARHVN